MASKQARLVKPPFGLSQVVVDKLIELQRRGIEYDGFIKGDNIYDIRTGDGNSVQPDIAPSRVKERGYEYDFHTHPRSGASMPDLPKKIALKEKKCSEELERVRDETASPNDVMFAAQYRALLDKGNNKWKSLIIAPDSIIRYYRESPNKYEEFKEREGRKRGKDIKGINITEDEILDAMNDKWKFIDNSLRSKIYEKQDFSVCGDRDRIVDRKRQWYNFLGTIGMNIDEAPISFSGGKERRGSK